MIEIGEEINIEQIVEDYANMEEKTIIGEEIELERIVNEYADRMIDIGDEDYDNIDEKVQ
jgi:hypothetical protein